MRLADQQPDNVCLDCGRKWGAHKLNSNESHRIWLDKCDVCGELGAIADASEYGYLVEGWDGQKVLR